MIPSSLGADHHIELKIESLLILFKNVVIILLNLLYGPLTVFKQQK